ncbi:MAG TPA: hypothetical protein DFR83_15690, partial [Deltaproteobacteria bacterium]|nr:hypothetical protein [Deltaproteobacteria bacterium]
DADTDADTGEPGFRYGNAASEDFYQGTWSGRVLSNDTDVANIRGCEAGTGWQAIDAAATADMLEGTNQNLYIDHQRTPVYGEDVCDWMNLEALAAELDARGSDIELMAVFRDDETYEEYQAAISGVRRLAAEHPRVKAMLSDDSNEIFGIPKDPMITDHLGPAEAAVLHELAASTTESGAPVAFMPYIPSEGVAPLLADNTVVIGARGCNDDCFLPDGSAARDGDYYIYPEDIIEVTVQFVPTDVTADQTYNLNFLISDFIGISGLTYVVDVVFAFDGVEVGRYSMVDATDSDPSLQLVELPIAGLQDGVENTLQISIDTAGTNATKYLDRIAYIWDGRITAPDGSESLLDITSITGRLERGTYAAERDFTTATMHATSNRAWRIRDHVDGTLTKFPLLSKNYDEGIHERFLEATCRSFKAADQPCLEVVWANDRWGEELVGLPGQPSLLPYLHAAQDQTDGVVLWMNTANLYDTTKGTMAPRAPWDEDAHSVAAGFGPNGLPIPGWYHRWSITAAEDGDYTVHWSDADATSAPEGRLYRTAAVNGAYTHEIELNSTDADLPTSTISVRSGDTIDLGVELRAGFGYAMFASQFGLTAPSGTTVDLSTATRTTGANAGTTQLYECFMQYFTSHDHEAACDTDSP